MNATIYQTSSGQDLEYRVDTRSTRTANRPKASRTSRSRRRRSAPQQFNGIHRRRKKKISW